jgi:hypothetical protein
MEEKKNITLIDEVTNPKTPRSNVKDIPLQKPRPLRLSRKTSDGASTGYNNIYDFENQSPEYPLSWENDISWIYDIKYLVFSGGGVKGFSYTGVITSLDTLFLKKRKNLYQQLEGLSGSSIGAMFALYVTLGVRGRQLIKEVMQTNIMELEKHMTIENLMDMYGLCLPVYFKQVVYDILERYMGKGDITFQELYDMTQKHYICCVTNITTNQSEYHSYKTTPNYRVFESVAASMCIPLLFAPCIINGECYVDGGMNDNCPFRVFPIQESLIFYLDGWKRTSDMSSFQQYIVSLAHNLWQTLDRTNFKLLKGKDRHRLFKINIEGLSSIDFHITPEQKKWLISKGCSEIERLTNPISHVIEVMKLLFKSLCYLVLEKKMSNK